MTPALAVSLPADRYETIRDVVACLVAQERREEIELIVVTDGDAAALEAALPADVFAAVRVTAIRDLRSMSAARAAAVRTATAPLIVLGETHSYPEPGWAAALIEAHAGDWAIVGPSIESAAPNSARAWVGVLMDYGPWVERRTSEPMHDVPAHNGCYDRAVLLALGDSLEEALAADQVLNERIRSAGGRLFLESAARTRHLNITDFVPFLDERLHAGRVFASVRAEHWPRPRRLAYAAAWPLIPAVRLVRIAGHLRRMGRLGSLGPRIAVPLVLGLVAGAIGEAFGYARGTGGSNDVLSEYELHRTAYATEPALPLQ